MRYARFVKSWMVLLLMFALGKGVAMGQDQNYRCPGGVCSFQYTTENKNRYPEITIFSGRSTMSYYIPLELFIPQKPTEGVNKFSYTIVGGFPSNHSFTNVTAFGTGSSMSWTDFLISGSSYKMYVAYSDQNQPSVRLGTDTLIINVDTAAPKFHYQGGVDTIFVGTPVGTNTEALRTPLDVIGADSIVYILSDSSYLGSVSTPDYSWVELDSMTGILYQVDSARQLGRFKYSVQAVRKSWVGNTQFRETRPDGLGLDNFSIFVVDSPTLVYRDTIIFAGSGAGSLSPSIDLKGISYVFSVLGIAGDDGVALPNASNYSVDAQGVFRWTNAFTTTPNDLRVTIQASTDRYGGQTVQRTVRIQVIDTPRIFFNPQTRTCDFDQNYQRLEDSTQLPTIEWRGDEGEAILHEVSWGYTQNGQFVQLGNTNYIPSEIRGQQTDIAFNTTTGEIRWSRATPAYEYRFKILVRNQAGTAPKRNANPQEDTGRFTLLIRPGTPTIRFAPSNGVVDTFTYNKAEIQRTIPPIIDWKGVPEELRKDSFALVEFEGSLTRTTWGTSTDQSRVRATSGSLEIENGQSANAGQLFVGSDYPTVMRAGTYYVRVYVWNVAADATKNSALDTIVVKPTAPDGFGYRLSTDLSTYNSYGLWRAYYYSVKHYYNDVDGGTTNVEFKGEVVDSGNAFHAGNSSIGLSTDFSDGGDTIRFVVDSVVFNGTDNRAAAFEGGFSIGLRDASFFWNGTADAVSGNISDFDDDTKPRPNGVNYTVILSARNSVGTTSDSLTFEVFRPRPILQFVEDQWYTGFNLIPNAQSVTVPTFFKPIDGTREIDTVVLPLKWPGQIIDAQNNNGWKYAPGRDGRSPSYKFLSAPGTGGHDKNSKDSSIWLDTTDIGRPRIVIRKDSARGGIIFLNLVAVNSYGTESVRLQNRFINLQGETSGPLGFGILIVDTPRGNKFTHDTLRVNCGFGDTANPLFGGSVGSSDPRAGYDGLYFGAEFVSITGRLTKNDDMNAILANVGRVRLKEKRADGTRIFTPGVFYTITIRMTNALTRGELGLPKREGAADTIRFVFIVDAQRPVLKYPVSAKDEYATVGGSITPSLLEWGCVEGKVRLFNLNRERVVDDSISIDSLNGTLRWNEKLKRGEYKLLVVAINSAGTSDTSYITLRIANHPPTNLSYNPHDISIPYGTNDSTATPTVQWYGNVGNFAIPATAQGLDKNLVMINLQTGVIYFSNKIPVGDYTLRPFAINVAGQTDTVLTVHVVPSKPRISYPLPSLEIVSGDVDSTELLENFDGGNPLKFSLEDDVQGIEIDTLTGKIKWNKWLAAGEYNLSIIATNGTLADTTTFRLIVAQGKYQPTETTTIADVVFFPNPITENNSGTLRFSITEKSTSVAIRLINIFGQQVKDLLVQVLTNGRHDIPLNLSGIPSGIYILELKTEVDVHRMRIVIVP